jgi:hypothetical protein
MGFNKRYINFKSIEKRLTSKDGLKQLFTSDLLIFEDSKSSKVHKWFKKGLTQKQIINKLWKKK